MLERLREAVTPDLKADTIAVLLGGWTAEAPEPSPHGFGGGLFECFEPEDAGIIRLWTTYELWLRAIARSWGWAPTWRGPDGVRRYFAEAIAWEHAHGVSDVHQDEADDEAE